MSDLPSNAPSPRVCHIFKWPDFDGYGFNLHADKTRPGQYIGKVDENSPADVTGLKEGDRIIEVNGVNIANENHKQVVQRIKAVLNETKLLVVDSEGDRWYKEHNLVVRGDQANVIYKTSHRSSDSPASQKSSEKSEKNGNVHEEDNKSLASSSSIHSEHSTQPQQNEKSRDGDDISDKVPVASLTIDDSDTELPPPPPPVVDDQTSSSGVPLDLDLSLEYDNIRFEQEEANKIPKVFVEESHSLSSHSSSRSRSGDETSKADNETTGSLHESDPDQEERKSPMSTTPSPPPSLNPEVGSVSKDSPSQNSSPSHNNSGLNLNMTVAEMRAHLASKKKFDPRKDSIDLKKKYQIVQNM